MEKEQGTTESEKRKRAWLTFGSPGHWGEYLINLQDFDGYRKPIPEHVCISLREELGDDWDISNHGSRIEISH